MVNFMNRCFVTLVILVLAFVSPVKVEAQSNGQLTGYVVDASGSSIPGVNIGVYLPLGKKSIYSNMTGMEGLFNIDSVRPDYYDVEFTKAGFASQFVRNVKVEPGGNTAVQTITLQIAFTGQIVDVIADNLSVESAAAGVSSKITNEQIQKLPITDRDPMVVMTTQAGVSRGRGFVVINGQRTSYSNVTLDGINIQDNFLRTNALEFVSNRLMVDQIAEVGIATSNASSAASGGSSHITFVTPSGTNSYHGSLYWYNRNSAVAANSWFNNRDGIARPNLNLNQIGGFIGGPLIKDKLLFYGNYEAYRLVQKSSQSRTILTADASQGIFTYVDSALAVRKVDVLQAAGVARDPAIVPILAAIPTADKINNFRTGDSSETLLKNTAGYSFLQRSNRSRDNVTLKLDYYASTKHTFSGTVVWDRNDSDRNDPVNGYTEIPKFSQHDTATLLSLGWRWNPIANFTNELRGGFNLAPNIQPTTEEFGAYIIAPTLISNPVNTQRAQGRHTDTYNLMDTASYTLGRHMIQFGVQAQQIRTAPYDDVGITPTYTLGIGTNPGIPPAQLPLSTTADMAAANNLLALHGGYVASYSQTFNINDRTSGFVNGATNLKHFLFDQYGLFVQDRWKATSRLTATLGLRFDYFGPVDERDGLFLLPQLVNNDLVATLLSNATLDFAGSVNGRAWYKKEWNNFAPNIGLAYKVSGDGKTMLRAGYSISYVNDEHIAAMRNSVNTNAGLTSAATGSGLAGRISTTLPVIPTPTYMVPRTFADNYAISRVGNVAMPDPNLKTPYVQEWNLGIQQDIHGTIIDLHYVGNHATKAIRAFDYNQVVIRENGFLDDFNRAMNNGILAKAATAVFNPAYNPAIPGSQPLTIFPSLPNSGSIGTTAVRNMIESGQAGELASSYQTTGTNGSFNFYRNPVALGANILTNASDSMYHALQVDVRRRFNGLEMQANYSFSKVIADASGDVQNRFEPFLDFADPTLERARAPFDITHAFKANAVYTLPAGRGHLFNPGGLDLLFGGWSTSGILSWQSGVPFSVLSGRGTVNRAARSTALNTADSIVDQALLDEMVQFRMTSTGPYIVAASAVGTDGRGVAPDGTAPFAGQLFVNPGPGRNGTLQRRSFNGPSLFNLDFALMKITPISENQTLEFRMEASNFFNNATWNVGDQTINSPTFGKITSTFYDSRRIQFSLHYRF